MCLMSRALSACCVVLCFLLCRCHTIIAMDRKLPRARPQFFESLFLLHYNKKRSKTPAFGLRALSSVISTRVGDISNRYFKCSRRSNRGLWRTRSSTEILFNRPCRVSFVFFPLGSNHLNTRRRRNWEIGIEMVSAGTRLYFVSTFLVAGGSNLSRRRDAPSRFF